MYVNIKFWFKNISDIQFYRKKDKKKLKHCLKNKASIYKILLLFKLIFRFRTFRYHLLEQFSNFSSFRVILL